jgi:hypothetical protein
MSFFSKITGGLFGAASGAKAGSIFGPVGTGIGAVLGGVSGLFGGGGGGSSSANTSAPFYAGPLGPTSFRNVLGEVNKEGWRDFKDELRSGVSSGFYTPDQAYQMAIQAKSGPSKLSSSFLSYEPKEKTLRGAAAGALRSYGYKKTSPMASRLLRQAEDFGIRDAGSMASFAQNMLALDPKNRYRGPLSVTDESVVSMYGPMVRGKNLADKTYRYNFNVKRHSDMA